MRIIGGEARGRRLKGPRWRRAAKGPRTVAGMDGSEQRALGPRAAGPGQRPTSDLVRGALFDALGDIRGARFLDCFAGVGTVGLEAVSRGAAEATLVEKHRGCLRVIRENVRLTGLAGRVRVVAGDAFREIPRLARRDPAFDVVFCDPPYDRGLAVQALQAVAAAGCVRPGGLVVVQHSKREALPPLAGRLELVRRRAYGDSVLSFYRCGERAEGPEGIMSTP